MTQTPLATAIEVSAARRYYLLILLALLNVLLVLDKIVLSVLLEPIREEFGLSDVQLGALMGLVYAIFVGSAGLPLGVLADRTNRRNLAAICLAAWSAMTMACAGAQNLWHLILARIGVGIGEAGGGPAAVSMIADTFEPRRRATAMAVFASGTQIAALVNLTYATYIAHAFGWRAALIAVAVPGLVLALLLVLTAREPPRGLSDQTRKAIAAPPFRETLSYIWQQRSLRHLLFGATLCYIVVAGMGSWHFTFLVRSHDLRLHEVGPLLGIGIAVLGILANVSSGALSDFLGARDDRYRTWFIALGALLALGIGSWSILTAHPNGALAGVIVFAATVTFWFPTVAALTQSLVQIRMRSAIAGLLFLLSNLIGYGIGPLLIGAISDALTAAFGRESLRLAMLCALSLLAWGALHFFLASRELRSNLAVAQQD
ncbi:MAG TPA: MFS transporter [Steroidobacteraceae bacterium]|jgi:predicted MFS family arabinose efflux permease|nr:MFS transporter [Steroidobacteraceae bacterium]